MTQMIGPDAALCLQDQERRLVSYLLFPRPQDAVKALIAPVTYFVAGAATGDFDHWARFLVLWVILELLVYNARYQMNDVRGLANDREHPERRLRGRLPAGVDVSDARRNARASIAVAIARLILAAAIGAMFGALDAVLIIVVVVALSSIIYEALRSRQPEQVRLVVGRREVSIWIVVGGGYALRGGLGLALGGFGGSIPGMAMGVAFFYSAGTTYVLLSWTLEASNFCAQVSGCWFVSERSRAKPHISTLLAYLHASRPGGPALVKTRGAISRQTAGYLGASSVLRFAGSPSYPWNVAFLSGATFAGPFAIALAGIGPAWARIMVCICCVSAGVCACLVNVPRARWRIVAAASIGLVLIAASAHAQCVWACPWPWILLSSCYGTLRSASYLGSMSLPESLGPQPAVRV